MLLLEDIALKQFSNSGYSESLFYHLDMSEVNGHGLLR